MRKIITITLCFLLLLSLSLLVEAQKIKTVDGVKVISNGKKPKPPKGSLSKLVLTEEMTWGDSEDPEKSFAGLELPFVVDNNGAIYGLDMKECQVKIFNDSGQLIQTFGKKGQGPGEFSMPSGIQVTPDDTLMIEDTLNRRLTFYSLKGEHIKDISLVLKRG